ncbi:hypothetical protein PR202_ga21077 [Eleusine coracana subsp. coracana]|uniref:mitogen-activated protein kinase kinase n=1 Tax=Eleusine coracana subsp. coracana TaxID=191504 RepID=A0AAV5CY87_ELECO|nr:hypothetical protein PR202_ga21077 [Eleusine coracana subsp. coracana]
MAGLEDLKRRLQPLFVDSEANGEPAAGTLAGCEVLDSGTVNLRSKSSVEYDVSEIGFRRRRSGKDEAYSSVRNLSFGVFFSDTSQAKREQILNELRTFSEASCYPGLVEFHGAFYLPDSGAICISLEYMDGGSLADIIRINKFIPEPVLACILEKVLLALRYLHEVRHVVHRDIKPENLLLNLKGDAKITDFGVTAGLFDSMSMCATFVGTVTYMSPERIMNSCYSYSADIWSLGLTVLECATGRFPYDVNGCLSDLMLQILDDPSPIPPKGVYSPEFCSFISACLQKDADARPTCAQVM